MQIDWSTFFAGAALLLSVASPIVTSCINSHSQKREYESKFYTQNKAETIEGYVGATCQMFYWNDQNTRTEYSKYYGRILLIVPAEIADLIISLDTFLSEEYKEDEELAQGKELLNTICLELSKHTPRIKKHKRNHIHE